MSEAKFIRADQVAEGDTLHYGDRTRVVIERVSVARSDGAIGFHANNDTWSVWYQPSNRVRVIQHNQGCGMGAQHTPAATAKKAQYKCACCGDLFTARVADRKRGWARYCSKSCKAKKQEAKTGQYGRYLQGTSGGLCFPDRSESGVQP